MGGPIDITVGVTGFSSVLVQTKSGKHTLHVKVFAGSMRDGGPKGDKAYPMRSAKFTFKPVADSTLRETSIALHPSRVADIGAGSATLAYERALYSTAFTCAAESSSLKQPFFFPMEMDFAIERQLKPAASNKEVSEITKDDYYGNTEYCLAKLNVEDNIWTCVEDSSLQESAGMCPPPQRIVVKSEY